MRELLRSPELKIVLINALTQPLGALSLAIGIVIGFYFWPPFVAIGVAGYLLIAWASLSDQAENQRVVQQELHPPRRLEMGRLRPAYKALVEQALAGQRKIDQAVASASPSIRETLRTLTRDVDDLVGTIYDIALKAQDVQTSLAEFDEAALRREIGRLEQQVAAASGYLRDQYSATLETRREQLQSLQQVREALARWQAQIDHAMATLGDIFTQVLRIKTAGVRTATVDTDGLSADLRDQVTAIRETARAFEQIYAQGGPEA